MMARCKGLHCNGCGHGVGGGGIGLVVIVALVLIAAIGKAAGHAISQVGHFLAVALEVLVITMAAAAGLGVAYLLFRAGIRVQRWRAARRETRTTVTQVSGVVRAEVIPPGRQAIEPPQPRFDQAAVHQAEPETAEPSRS